ncbi:MAG: hypothetical protein M0C28_20050 [Candidatus Moduliflexus flocculans]|nr:hypothetical protein [Candidatus Moduliflexus flocculans]
MRTRPAAERERRLRGIFVTVFAAVAALALTSAPAASRPAAVPRGKPAGNAALRDRRPGPRAHRDPARGFRRRHRPRPLDRQRPRRRPSRTRLALGRAGDKGVGTETTSAIVRRLGALAGTQRRLLPDGRRLPGRTGGHRPPGRQGPQRALPQEARPGRFQQRPADAPRRRGRRSPGRGRRREKAPPPDRRHQPAPPRRRAHPVHAGV